MLQQVQDEANEHPAKKKKKTRMKKEIYFDFVYMIISIRSFSSVTRLDKHTSAYKMRTHTCMQTR